MISTLSLRSLSRALAPLALLGAATLHPTFALAAEPSTAECLLAHDEATELRAKHELRAARAHLQSCAADSCPAGLRTTCAAEASQLNAAIPTVILDAVDAAGNDVSHVRVTMDGEPLIDRIDGSAAAVEPGSHKFVFEVEGRPPEEKTLVMVEGEKNKRVRIEIAPPPPPPSHDGETLRALGLAFGGTAVVAAAIGTGFGLSARSNLSKSRSDCADSSSTATCANEPLAASEQQTANTQATIATGAFIGAGVFLAAGAILFLNGLRLHPQTQSASAGVTVATDLGPSGGSILLRGSF
jgi:hypothetical protein